MLRTPRHLGDASLIAPASSEPPAPIVAPAAATDPAESDPSTQRRAITSLEAHMAAAATRFTATGTQILNEMSHLVAEAGRLRAEVGQTEERITVLVERLESLLTAPAAENESRVTEPSCPSPSASVAAPRARATHYEPLVGKPLTPREREVLQLLAWGLTDIAIACELNCSPRTVNKHVSEILLKLNVESRTAAAYRALQLGLID